MRLIRLMMYFIPQSFVLVWVVKDLPYGGTALHTVIASFMYAVTWTISADERGQMSVITILALPAICFTISAFSMFFVDLWRQFA